MAKIFCLLGKSASGKDTLFKLIKEAFPQLRTATMYTTRPIRENERDGVEYYFVSGERYRELEAAGRVIECRTYQTIAGPWHYFTVDDGQIDLTKHSYLMLGTLVSFEKMREYYGQTALYPLYIELDDGLRLERSIARERIQSKPNYREICRRFLADDVDFSEENVRRLGITKRYENIELDRCLEEIRQAIEAAL